MCDVIVTEDVMCDVIDTEDAMCDVIVTDDVMLMSLLQLKSLVKKKS